MSLQQNYLVAISVIMAWQLRRMFPLWTTWCLLICLAFYDLCAVLTPCGPLKCLVNLVIDKGRPLPGLLYEADVPNGDSGTAAPTRAVMDGGRGDACWWWTRHRCFCG